MDAVQPVVTLICDSRGKDLEKMLDPQQKINVLYYSGAKLYQAVKLAESKLKHQNSDQVYILAGINNLTKMDRKTRQVSILVPDKTRITQQLSDEINFSYTSLRKIVRQDTKIIFAPITGMNIAQYNKTDPKYCEEDQFILNQAILDIHQRIISFNEENGNKTPWTHGIVHRYYRGKYHYAYDRLDYDGCHLTDEVRAFWIRKITTAIVANSDATVKN